jgi:hypothetical protein
MWAGVVYGSLLEHRGDHILLSGGAQIFLLEDATHWLARDISQSDSFHALNAPS